MSDQQRPVLGGRYELYRRIARGGMAEVFLARDQLLDRPVAVKVLFPEFAADPAFVERFRREAQAAANLTHPNVVGVFDWGAERGTYYIVMEYVEGKTLADIIRSEGPLDPRRAASITTEVAAGLSLAHSNGVVHRDVKPGNVLITSSGQVKVTDFGIARAISGPASDGLTQTGSVMGTATYLSPEQAQGQPADPRSDVYALSVVLYEMLTGRPPFTGDTPVAIAFKHVREDAVPPRQRNSAVPAELEAITLHGLGKEPDARYVSADEMRGDLRAFLDGDRPAVALGAAAAVPPAAPPPPPPRQAPPVPPRVQPQHPDYAPTTAMPTSAAPPPGYPPTDHYVPPDEGYPPRQTALVAGGIVAAVAVLGLMAFLFIQAIGGDGSGDAGPTSTVPVVTVESVVGLTLDEARALLEGQGLVVEEEPVESDTAPSGEVVAQFPRAGQEVNEGDTVRLTVSQGQGLSAVPDLVGLSEDEARALIREAGFAPDITREETTDEPDGTILSQDPAAGTELARGETVRITIASGAELVELTDVSNLTDRAALTELANLGLQVTIEEESSADVDEGLVIRTEPPALSQVQRGDSVLLVVSSGPQPIILQSYEGADGVAARNDLERQGLVVDINEVIVPQGSNLVDKVVATNPPAGAALLPGETVTLSIGVEAEPPPTTTTTTQPATTTTQPATTTTQPATTTTQPATTTTQGG